MREAVLQQRPDLMPVLEINKFFHSYQGAQDPSQPPYYRCPVFDTGTQAPIARTNRRDTTAAQRDFPEVPRMTSQMTKAMDCMFDFLPCFFFRLCCADRVSLAVLDKLTPSEEYCYSMELERGDMQLLNNFVIWHSRTSFEDLEEPSEKRHPMRLWLSTPNSRSCHLSSKSSTAIAGLVR